MAARGRRPGFNPRAGIQQPKQESGVHAALLKNARKSGNLNLSNRGLTEVPDAVWRINLDVPAEAKNVSLDNTEDRWWEQVDMTKLILASNRLSRLSDDITQLPALSVLDVHDNNLEELPDGLGRLTEMKRLHVNHNKLTHLPMCLATLTNLTSLQIAHNQLQDLGEHIGNLIYLEELDISNNLLVSLPRSIGYLSRMFKFNISNNKIQELPLEIGDMSSLRMLDCTHNVLQSIPADIGRLTRLEQLYLRHNRLVRIPMLTNCEALKELHMGNNALQEITAEHLNHLQHVSVLDVRDNKIAVLPDEITILVGLERLDLTNNDLSTLPYALGTLNSLKSIVLDGNPMKKIRRDIIMRGTNEIKKYLRSRMDDVDAAQGSVNTNQTVKPSQGTSGIIGSVGELDPFIVQSTKALDYSGKKVGVIPEEVWSVIGNAEVQTVNFSKNALSQWPDRLSLMSATLQELNLGTNRLTSVPADIGMMIKLTFLDLRNNMLSNLPEELSNLQSLRELTLSANRFRDIPQVVYSLRRLEVLLFTDNQIQNINIDGVKGLTQLATLDIQNNDIMQVPPELGNCTQLRSLKLEGNPFRQPRPAILTKGTNTILEYLRGRIVV